MPLHKQLSIIVVTYNAGATLERLLQSIINQKTEAIELIIIDGASNDNSSLIFEAYKSSIDVFVSEKDKGIYDAMNKGIAKAKGDWLYFVGADDRVNEKSFDCLLKVAPIYDGFFIFGDYYETSPHGKQDLIIQNNYSNRYQLLKGCLNHQSVFIKKQVFDLYGYYNINYTYCADYEFYARIPFPLLKKAKKINYPIAFYNNTGLSSVSTQQVYQERAQIISKHFGVIIGFMYSLYTQYIVK